MIKQQVMEQAFALVHVLLPLVSRGYLFHTVYLLEYLGLIPRLPN